MELTYNGCTRRWEGERQEPHCFLWMDDATFQRYVQAYLEAQGIEMPTEEQRAQAVQRCRQLSYWKNCYDPNVHMVRLGKGAQ